MATPQEELDRLNAQIAELRKQLGDFTEFIPLQNLKDAQRLFVQLKRETNTIGDSLDYIARSFRDSVRELSRQNTELGATKSSLRSISSISNKILSTRSLDGEISEKELSTLEKKADLQFRSLNIAIRSGRLQGETLNEAKSALKSQEEFFKATQSIREEQIEINKNAGVKLFTGLQDITQAIPGLRTITSSFSEASIAAKEQARFNKEALGSTQGLSKEQIKNLEIVKSGGKINQEKIKSLKLEKLFLDKNGNILQGNLAKTRANTLLATKSISPLKAGFQSLGPALTKALGPLALLTEVVKTFTRIDKITGNIAKNLGISYQTSLGVTRQFNKIALSSESLFVTTENLAESFVAINKTLGTNSSINNEILQTQTELVKQAGYSTEAATQLSVLSLATGESAKELTTEFLGQVTLLNAQNNLAVNEKQLLESIATVSKGTLATFASQTDELGRAAFEARRLGLTLAQIESISDGLLDIESSIAAEFEAEVISGRQLFLERARLFALNNDLAGVARELAAQDITRASFAKANRLEQQSIAKALGLSRDELGQMLLEQEALTKLSGIEGNTAQERFNRLAQEVGLAEARRRIGDDTLANQLASVSVQEKFNATVGKLQELFVNLVDPLLPILNIFGEVLTIVGKIVKFLTPIIPTATLLGGIFTANPYLIGLGASGVIGQISQAVQDGIAPASKGPFTITDRFGEMAITAPGDALFASPNVSPANVVTNNNTTTSQTIINNTLTSTPNPDLQVKSNLLLESIKSDISNLIPQNVDISNIEGNNLLRGIKDNLSNLNISPTVNVPSIINENTEGNNLLRDIRNSLSNISSLESNITVSPITSENVEGNNLLRDIRNSLSTISSLESNIPNITVSPIVENNTQDSNLLKEIRDQISKPFQLPVPPPQPTNITVSPIVNESTKVVSLLEEIKKGISSIFIPETNITLPSFSPIIAENTEGNSILRSIESLLTSLLPSQIVIKPTITPQVIEKEPTIPAPLNVTNTTIVREDRNINTTVTLSEKDIRAIANAVREGAMEGTSKANVQAVIPNRTVSQLSTRIQPELAVNTYRSAY